MPQYTPNNKYYSENQTVPNQLEYPILGAAGSGARKRDKLSFYRPGESSLEELIKASAGNLGSEFSNEHEFGTVNIDPDQKNEILGIPAFLSYPSDLGLNRRFHHFIVFNIYQGTSDQVRLKTREYNQATSSLLAKGGVQFSTQSGGGKSESGQQNDVYNTLIRAGFSQQQANDYSRFLFGGSGGAGITTDERIGAIDNLLQGALSNANGVDPTIAGNVLDPLAGLKVGGAAIDFAVQAGRSTVEYAQSLVQSTNRDNLADASRNPKNFNQRGVSGRAVNRPEKDQNILLANRRFNNANVKSKDTICLYMPQKFSINDQLIYSEEDMGTSKMLLDALTGKRGAASALMEKIGRRGISDVIGKIGEAASNVPGVGGALNETLQETNSAAVRAAATRTVANPRKEMMFRDVGVRTHSFSFDFAPKNEKEAETVLNIIRMLRYHAYPGLQGGGGHFFTFPAEFELTFFTIQGDSGMVVVNDNLPKLPRLALQSVSVDFSAAGDFKTFTDAKPAFIRLELGFQEMEQLTNEHIVHGY